MTVTTKTIAELQLSRFNVRTNETDANATAALEASIKARGLLYPLVGHPLAGSKKLGILAGGRRYRAIKNLVARGDLPADWPIDVVVRDVSDAELTELSLAENLIRRELRPYEIYAAVAKAHRLGATLQEIADTNGQELPTVRGWLRLGSLAAPIFKALERGDLSVEQAKAFAATEDQRLQLSAFDAFAQLATFQRTPAAIRKLLKVGDAEEARLLALVGEDAYRAAGGAYELDLFAEDAEQRGRVADPGLLRQLADAVLEGQRTIVRRRTGRPDLRFVPEPPQGNYGTDWSLEITPNLDVLTGEAAERAQFLLDECAELEFAIDRADDPEKDAAMHAELAAHRAELDALEETRAIRMPAGDIVACFSIFDNGPRVQFFWASQKAKRAASVAPARNVSAGPIAPAKPLGSAAIGAGIGTTAQQQAGQAAKLEHGFVQEGVQIARSVRRELLRAAFVDEGGCDIAHDYLIWSLLRQELDGARSAEVGARGLARADDGPPLAMHDAVRSAVEAAPAHDLWDSTLAALRAHPAFADADPCDALAAFHDETAEWKAWAAATVAGMALARSANLDGYRLPVHDLLGRWLGLADRDGLTRYWRATEPFVELLPRDRRIEAAAPFMDEAERQKLGKAKAAETVLPITRALQRAGWIHPALKFDAAEQLEAAE